jgi:hypothetical protein
MRSGRWPGATVLSTVAIFFSGVIARPASAVGTSEGSNGAPPASSQIGPRRTLLTQKIVEMATSDVPLDEAVTKIFGSRLGPPQRHGIATHWTLSPNEILATGDLDMRGTKLFLLEIVPATGLNYTFADIEKQLLDFPFYIFLNEGHMGDDSMATAVTAIAYIFRVPGGELMLYEAATIPPGSPRQPILMTAQAHEVAYGRAKRKVLIERIVFRRDPGNGWDDVKTLRAFRKHRYKPGETFRSIIHGRF